MSCDQWVVSRVKRGDEEKVAIRVRDGGELSSPIVEERRGQEDRVEVDEGDGV